MNLQIKVLFSFVIIYENFISAEDSPIINTKNGPIRGRISTTVNLGKKYYAFQSIPYAEPPIGKLRFQSPLPAKNWTEVLNATNDPSTCVQNSNPVIGSEDCLYLNVYTPNLSPETPLTVMVWIYGGAFIGGNSNYSSYAPDFFLETNVIVVTLNYRLGVFGFLSTDNLVVPGNMGLKDQVLALKWVKSNIGKFGGDPEKITIFGESAGSASVSYHLQSKLSEGLFRAAIMESGTSLCLWALFRRQQDAVRLLGTRYLISTANSTAFVEKLRTIDYVSLQKTSYRIFLEIFLIGNFRNGLIFAPVIEPEHEGAFFSNKSYELLKNGHFIKVPTIIGFNSFEILLNITIPMRLYVTKFNLDLAELVPIDMNINSTTKKVLVGGQINKFYFGIVPLALNSRSLLQFFSDDQFNRPIRETVKLQSKYSLVYYYKFSYEGQLGKALHVPYEGVQHAGELNYFWYRPVWGTKKDNLTRDRAVKLWTNFAKFGNPTPVKDPLFGNVTWPIASKFKDELVFLNINDTLKVENSSTKYIEFWNSLYNKNPSPYDTY